MSTCTKKINGQWSEVSQQARSCLNASTRVRTHHFHNNKKEKKGSIICVSNYFVSYCSGSIFINHVHAIIFKIFNQICLKIRPKFMSQKIDRNQNTLGSATINPCHPDISLMTEPEQDTCIKKIAKREGGVGLG